VLVAGRATISHYRYDNPSEWNEFRISNRPTRYLCACHRSKLKVR